MPDNLLNIELGLSHTPNSSVKTGNTGTEPKLTLPDRPINLEMNCLGKE